MNRPPEPVYRGIAEDEHGAVASLLMLSFGRLDQAGAYQERTRPEDFRVLEVGGELASVLELHRLGQWWLGRRVPSAQVFSLATAPTHGGRGHAQALLRGLLHELHGQGVPTVTLFASTLALYRRVGFECAGTWTRYQARAEHLPRGTGPYRARQLDLDDLETVRGVYDRVAPTRHGALDRDERAWRWLTARDRSSAALFLLEGPEGPAGWALLGFGTDEGWRVRLAVRDWGCLPGAERALLGLLGGYWPRDGSVTWNGPDPDPALLVLPEHAFSVPAREHWLLRLVDLPAAFGARPYPEALRGTVRLSVEDPLCPWNGGNWLLEVAEGTGRMERISTAALLADVRGLAALFTGFLDPEDLARVGLLTGAQPHELALLRAAFCTRRPWVAEHY